MVKLKKGKTVAILEKETDSKQDNVEEEPTEVLQKLASSEADLIEEKKKLASLREKLQLKVQGEIENKRKNIEKLRAEIMDLKFSCEELTKSLKAQRRNTKNGGA